MLLEHYKAVMSGMQYGKCLYAIFIYAEAGYVRVACKKRVERVYGAVITAKQSDKTMNPAGINKAFS
jgi:hypothetical protein